MSERQDEAVVELRDLLYDIRRASEDTHYGYFIGGDPNDFTPDPEASTEEERALHAKACAEFKAGRANPNPAPHCAFMNEGVPPQGFGLGTMVLCDANATDWAERLERCIARLETP